MHGFRHEETTQAATSPDPLPWADLIARPADGIEKAPWRVSVRDLSRNLSKVFSRVHQDSCPTVVTYRGVPTWVVLPLDQSRLASFLLSNVEELTTETIRSEVTEAEKHVDKGGLRTLKDFLG